MKVYYAHSKRIYDTRVEVRDMLAIVHRYPQYTIVNPSRLFTGRTAQDQWNVWMEEHGLDEYGLVVFTTYDGYVGRGVFEEITYALQHDIPVVYLTPDDRFTKKFFVSTMNDTDWVRYAKIEVIPAHSTMEAGPWPFGRLHARR
jgi:hypothetical protein